MSCFIPLFCILNHSAYAQDTIYCNSMWEKTDAAHATYYRVRMRVNGGWHVTDHFRGGKLQMTGDYADDSMHVNNGEFTWYDEKGINRRCHYVNGKLDGSDTLFYPNAKKKVTGQNKDGDKEGQWTGYYPTGKVAAKATYQNGKQMSAVFYNEDGSVNKDLKVFIQDANYPGGPAQFLRFLNKNLKYPDVAMKQNIQGTVVVNFKISKDGSPSNFKVVQSVNKVLDDEALRVLNMMKDWQPAIVGGIYSDSFISQPVVFHL